MTHSAQPRRSALLFIDSLKIGGAERVSVQWAAWLLEAGWSVTLLTSKSCRHDFYPVPTGLRRLQEPSSQGLLNHALFWPLKLWRLRTLLRREQPDVLIDQAGVGFDRVAFSPGALRAKLSSRPSVGLAVAPASASGVSPSSFALGANAGNRAMASSTWFGSPHSGFAQFDRLAATALCSPGESR